MHALCAALFLTLSLPHAAVDVVFLDWSNTANGAEDLAAVRREYVAALNARDLARVSTLYTRDALAKLDDRSLIRGANELERRLAAVPSLPEATAVTLAPRRFSNVADVGWETGTFRESVGHAEAQHVTEGIYLAIYSRDGDGRWRIALEIRTTGGRPSSTIW